MECILYAGVSYTPKNTGNFDLSKSTLKCGISNSLDGTEDNLLFEDSDDDFCGFDDED
jgi:hypothetical protein